MKEEVKKWLKKAKRDFNIAKYLFKGKKYEEASLFCQQSCEKIFKAVLLKREGKIIKTHDLSFLAEKINLPDKLRDFCKGLTMMYVYSRYPDTSEIKDKKAKAKEYISFVGDILKWVKEQI